MPYNIIIGRDDEEKKRLDEKKKTKNLTKKFIKVFKRNTLAFGSL